MPDPATVLAAALEYATVLGWPVLPIFPSREDGQCACDDPGCLSPGKHPCRELVPHGLKDATTDPDIIRGWFRAAPGSNVAVATGIRAGVIVLDVDPRHRGDESLAELLAAHSTLPDTVVQLTGGGGEHYVFRHPGGQITNRSNVVPGIDVRADGGYVLVEPSNHRSGGEYVFEISSHPRDIAPAHLPGWLLKLIRKAPATTQALRRRRGIAPQRISRHLAAWTTARLQDDVPDRSGRDFHLLCGLVRAGVDPEDAWGLGACPRNTVFVTRTAC